MAVEDSVAQDQLRAFIERIERMEEEKSAIASDIKEIYAEAKGNGFDTKILRKIVAIRKQDANERMEQEAILDLYMGALGMVVAPPDDDEDYAPRHGSNAVPAAVLSLDDLVERLADHVDPELLMTIIEGSKTEAGRKIIMGALAAVNADDVVSTAHISNSKPQPPQPAGSDLTDPQPSGQVATHPVANAEEEANGKAVASDDAASREVDDADRQQVAASGFSGDAAVASAIAAPIPEPDATPAGAVVADTSGVTGGESAASLYPRPGEVYWENTPREPVRRHRYSEAFGTLGQDIHVITEDISKAQSAAIVMIGADILDGWARYNVARSTVGLDGQTTEYPAYQYDGTDPLLDCIRWNVNGRILNDDQRRLIAKRLVTLDPKRRDDIFKALGFGMELVA